MIEQISKLQLLPWPKFSVINKMNVGLMDLLLKLWNKGIRQLFQIKKLKKPLSKTKPLSFTTRISIHSVLSKYLKTLNTVHAALHLLNLNIKTECVLTLGIPLKLDYINYCSKVLLQDN